MPRLIISDILAGTHLHNPGPAQTNNHPANNPRFAVPQFSAAQARSVVQDHGDLIASLLARIEELEERVKRLEQAQNGEVEPQPEREQQPRPPVRTEDEFHPEEGQANEFNGQELYLSRMSDIDDVSSGDRYDGEMMVEFSPPRTPELSPIRPPSPRLSPIGSPGSTPPENLLQLDGF